MLQISFTRYVRQIAAVLLTAVGCVLITSGQDDSAIAEKAASPARFRMGEKLAYELSFGRFSNAGHAEIAVVSRGRLSGVDVIELRSRIKTFDVVSAALVLVDETRNVYVSPDTGLPLYVRKVSNARAVPKEAIYNYLKAPTTSFDLLTLIYKMREAGGAGTFTIAENEQIYNVTLAPVGAERIRTDVGDLDTNVSTVQSEFFTALGITEMRVGLTTDEHRVPAFIKFRTVKGEFRAILASITLPESPAVKPTPTPTPAPTPAVKPSPTPDAYVENQPLLPELGFALGELLDYRVTLNNKPAGSIALNARERRRFDNQDCLVLTASVTAVAPGLPGLRAGDTMLVRVDPNTLAPKYFESRFDSPFASLNQTLTFDPKGGEVGTGGKSVVDAPVGTHTILSLIYAIRSFNLKPSKDPSNPVNDTRVAVFWGDKPLIFTLRPSGNEELTIGTDKFAAQLITITSGDPVLDKLGLRIWLGTEDRVPLRFSAGPYQADLASRSSNLPK